MRRVRFARHGTLSKKKARERPAFSQSVQATTGQCVPAVRRGCTALRRIYAIKIIFSYCENFIILYTCGVYFCLQRLAPDS